MVQNSADLVRMVSSIICNIKINIPNFLYITWVALIFFMPVMANALSLCEVKYGAYEHVNTIESEESYVDEVIKIQLDIKSPKLELCNLKHAIWFLPGSHRQIKVEVDDPVRGRKTDIYSTSILSLSPHSPKTITLSSTEALQNSNLTIVITSRFNQLKIKKDDEVFFSWLPPANADEPLDIKHVLKAKNSLQGQPYHLGMRMLKKKEEGKYIVYESSAIRKNSEENDCNFDSEKFEKISCEQISKVRAVGWTSYSNYAEIAKLYLGRVEKSIGRKIGDFSPQYQNNFQKNSDKELLEIIQKEVLHVRKLLRYKDSENTSGFLLELRPVEKILASEIGVCREFTTVLVSRLLEKNIEAHPVLVNIRESQMWIPIAPVPAFDHALVYIPSLDIYVDPTDTSLAPTSMYQAMVGRAGLNVVTGKLIRIHLGKNQLLNIKA